VTDLQQIIGIVSEATAVEMKRKQFLFVDPQSTSSQTSTGQTLHLVKSVVTSCVGLTHSSLIDSSALGVVCFAHLWKRGLCLQALQTSLTELMRSCGLDLDCFRIAILSSAHMVQFLAAKVLTALIGLPCQMALQVTPPRWWLGTNWCHRIELKNAWRMSPISH